MITLKEESQELNEAEEKDRCKKLGFMTAEQSETETTSSGNRAQPCPYICGQCGKSFGTKVKIDQHLRIHSKRTYVNSANRVSQTSNSLRIMSKFTWG